jgi:hypothetical protein
MSLWIVGICWKGGRHEYFVHDCEDDAKLHAANLIGRSDLKVFCWDMFGKDDRRKPTR